MRYVLVSVLAALTVACAPARPAVNTFGEVAVKTPAEKLAQKLEPLTAAEREAVFSQVADELMAAK